MTPTIKPAGNIIALFAWTSMFLVSMLPDILFRELIHSLPGWLFLGKLALIGILLLGSLFHKGLRPLRLFFAILLVFNLVEWGGSRFYEGLGYLTWFAKSNAFIQQVGPGQFLRATSTFILVLVMWALLGRFERFFLVIGDLKAQAQPIRFILDRPPSWRVLGPAISGAMCLGLLTFIYVFGRHPSLQILPQVLPLLPFVLLLAASNAAGEEMLYRAWWLSTLEGPLGPAQALLITAVNFGIAHFYGVPYGVLGCIMAFIPGWLMGKAMLETRGFFWAWFIHFWMDVVILFFIALGSVTPGG